MNLTHNWFKYNIYVGNVPNFFQASKPTELRLEQDRERKSIFPDQNEVRRQGVCQRLNCKIGFYQLRSNFKKVRLWYLGQIRPGKLSCKRIFYPFQKPLEFGASLQKGSGLTVKAIYSKNIPSAPLKAQKAQNSELSNSYLMRFRKSIKFRLEKNSQRIVQRVAVLVIGRSCTFFFQRRPLTKWCVTFETARLGCQCSFRWCH